MLSQQKQKLYMVGITQNKQECLTLIVVPLKKRLRGSKEFFRLDSKGKVSKKRHE